MTKDSGIYQPTRRGFEVAKGFKDINLPVRATKNAAGYDFECAKTIKIEPVWKAVPKFLSNLLGGDIISTHEEKAILKPVLVPTGVKAYMGPTEGLFLYNRSSNPLKKFLLLGNGVGVVDSDYYNNPDNDGHIMFQFINFGLFPVTIQKGERIGQGVFQPFLKTTDDLENGIERKGGHGSTGN
jgi:dUTP pyrophosphatase